jgi:hypothetical protein
MKLLRNVLFVIGWPLIAVVLILRVLFWELPNDMLDGEIK